MDGWMMDGGRENFEHRRFLQIAFMFQQQMQGKMVELTSCGFSSSALW